MADSIDRLREQLRHTPVVGRVHPLLPLALPKEVHSITVPAPLIAHLDSVEAHDESDLLILTADAALAARFPSMEVLSHPPVADINRNMAYHLDYARSSLLTSRKIAARIEHNTRFHTPDVIALLLIDGLSYGDVLGWGEQVSPSFVDGPSVTYQFHPDDPALLMTSVGFAAITNDPSIFARLFNLGYRNGRGFTYWQPQQNVIADRVFGGMPFVKTADFSSVLALLEDSEIAPGSFVQIVRQGLDGLAHNKREIRHVEIEATIQAVRGDVNRLCDLLRRKNLSACVYITADHGILWRDDHPLEVLGVPQASPRYSTVYPTHISDEAFTTIPCGDVNYHLFRYPYLGSQIPSDDRGVHGGLSYQESIVPFIEIEV